MTPTTLNDLKASISSLIDSFGSTIFQEIESLTSQLDQVRLTLHERDETILMLIEKLEIAKSTVSRLENELGIVTRGPIEVNAPPTNINVSIDGKPCRFSGPGEVNPYSINSERRWFVDHDKEIRVILDATENGQRKLTIQRAWSDLPVDSPVREVKAKFDGEAIITREFSLRLHHHTRPRFNLASRMINPSRFDDIRSNLPNYDYTSIATDTPIDWRWKVAEDLNRDVVSENYYLAHQSWTGGVPLSNEASMLSPWDIYFLSRNGETGNNASIIGTWDSIGNYPIHFYDRETGKPCTPSSRAASLIPTMKLENLPEIKSKDGKILPVPDLAHNFGLPNLGAMLTGDRYYIEGLESFILLPSLSYADKERRASGLYWSGQIRSNAWRMRDLYHAYIATKEERYRQSIIQHLEFMNESFVNPTSSSYSSTGLLSFVPRKESNWNRYAIDTELETPTGNHYFLIHVLSEIAKNKEFSRYCRNILLHLFRLVQGVWETSPSKFLIPWLRHVTPSSYAQSDWRSGWQEIMNATFSFKIPTSSLFVHPITFEMACWYRAAVIAVIDNSDEDDNIFWAISALQWIDSIVPMSRRPIAWNIRVMNNFYVPAK